MIELAVLTISATTCIDKTDSFDLLLLPLGPLLFLPLPELEVGLPLSPGALLENSLLNGSYLFTFDRFSLE